jgi:predicted permease
MTSNTLTMQVYLLSLMLVGLICAKTRIIEDHTRSSLSDLILNVFLPCTILSSFFGSNRSQFLSLGAVLLISAGVLLFGYVLGNYVLYRKVGPEQKKVLLYATIISNATFVGNPVVESIYGLDALIYSAAYLIPIRVALWTAGIALFAGGKGNIKKIIFHPCLIATYLGFLVMGTGFQPPLLLARITSGLGNCTTPVSMIVVGSILGTVRPQHVFSKLTAYYSFIRLIFIPLTLLGVLMILRPAPIISGVTIILSGTPAAATTPILADKYGSDRELASKIIFLSTVLSIVTIPGLLFLLQHLLP